VHADLDGAVADEAGFVELVDGVRDRLVVALGHRVRAFAKVGVVGEVIGPTWQRGGFGAVGHEDADRDGLGRGRAGADLVERLLHSAEQCLGREAEEVDGDIRALERALDNGTQADRARGAFAHEDPAALT
jgi:hypothetical protein